MMPPFLFRIVMPVFFALVLAALAGAVVVRLSGVPLPSLPWTSPPEEVSYSGLTAPPVLAGAAPIDSRAAVPPLLGTLADGAKAETVKWVSTPTEWNVPVGVVRKAAAGFGLPLTALEIRRAGASRDERAPPAKWGVDANGAIRRIDARSSHSLGQAWGLLCGLLAAMMGRIGILGTLRKRGWSEARDPGPFRLAEAGIFLGLVSLNMANLRAWPADWTDWVLLAACGATFFMGSRGRWRAVALAFAAVLTARALQIYGVAPHPDLASGYGVGGLYAWDVVKLALMATASLVAAFAPSLAARRETASAPRPAAGPA